METGDRREGVIGIRKIKKSITPGSSAFAIAGNADCVGIPERQSESVKLCVGDVPGDISYIDFQY